MDPAGNMQLSTLLSIVEILVIPILGLVLWCIRDLYDRHVKAIEALAKFREEVAKQYATHETMERTELKLLTEIRNLASKLDRFIERYGAGNGHD